MQMTSQGAKYFGLANDYNAHMTEKTDQTMKGGPNNQNNVNRILETRHPT